MKSKQKTFREWIKAILIAAIFTLVVRTFLFQSFIVSNSQMATSLLPGDFIVVNKWKAGARTTITPLAIPFFEKALYLNWINFKVKRLVKININSGDILLFNYPKEVNKNIDKRLICISRLTALPGDTLAIKNKCAFVNNNIEKCVSNLEYEYNIITSSTFRL